VDAPSGPKVGAEANIEIKGVAIMNRFRHAVARRCEDILILIRPVRAMNGPKKRPPQPKNPTTTSLPVGSSIANQEKPRPDPIQIQELLLDVTGRFLRGLDLRPVAIIY
jgi:hypothetical protein